MRYALLLLVLLAPTCAAEPLTSHPVLQELTTSGLLLVDGKATPLPKPKFTPSMSAEEQEAAFKELVGARRMEKCLQNSIVAPFERSIQTLGTAESGDKVRSFDMYFAAHGNLKVIREKNLMSQIMGSGDDAKRLAKDGIETYVKPADDSKPKPDEAPPRGTLVKSLSKYRFPVLEKVVVSGLVEGAGLELDGALVQTAVSPRDKLQDKDNPSRWFPIPRGAKTDADLGPPAPFEGFVCYMQATQLKFAEDVLMIECHAAYLEPKGWFRGRNLLASKLPLVMQQNVRDFRKKLKKALESQE